MEQLMTGQTEQRIEALKRRFQIIEMRWETMKTKQKFIYWKTNGNWKPSKELHDIADRWRHGHQGPSLKTKTTLEERSILILQEMEVMDQDPDEVEIQK